MHIRYKGCMARIENERQPLSSSSSYEGFRFQKPVFVCVCVSVIDIRNNRELECVEIVTKV